MANIVKCPECGEVNIGSRLLCAKCQTSLIGVPREQGDSPLVKSTELTPPAKTLDGQKPPALAQTDNTVRPVKISPGIYTSTIAKDIRSWAITLLVLGVIHIFMSDFLSADWGVTIIIVGLASFFFRSSAMMVVYGVTLAWAGVSNVLTGQTGWIGFALLQWFLAFRVFRRFFQYRVTEKYEDESEIKAVGLTPKRTEKAFPWIAGGLGILSLLGFIGVFLAVVIIAVVSGEENTSRVFYFIEGLTMDMALVAFAIGLPSILSKYRLKGLAITGMITGLIVLVVEILFPVLLIG